MENSLLTKWIWILVRTALSVFLYIKFHKNLISVLFEDRKVHFALMGEDQSVQLQTALPPHRVNICGSLFRNLLLKTNGRCPHRFQCKLSPQSGTGKFSARGIAPLVGGFASCLPLTVWIWEWTGAGASCPAVLSQGNVPCGLRLCQHSC